MSNYRDSMKEHLDEAYKQKHIEAEAARKYQEHVENAYVQSRQYYTPEKFDEINQCSADMLGKEDDEINRIKNIYANPDKMAEKGDMDYLYNYENKLNYQKNEVQKNAKSPSKSGEKGIIERLANTLFGGNNNVD